MCPIQPPINATNGSKRGDRFSSDNHHLSSSLLKDLDRYLISSMHYTSPKLIKAANVSLPAVAGTAKLLDIVPPALAAIYATPQTLH
jgi:hypothetical protein